MTTILAVQGEDFAVIGTDSRISQFDDSGMAWMVTTLGTGSTKVAENGKYLIGVAGDVRAINILHHAFQPPPPPPTRDRNKLDSFMTKHFVTALRKTFEDHGYASPTTDQSQHVAEQQSSIIVAVNGTIYVVEGDYGWTSDKDGVYAIGTGASFALGAVSALGKQPPASSARAERQIVKALAIASRFDPYTGAPFQTFVQHKT